MTLGDKIATLKIARHITTEELSAKSGVPIGTINKILNGETQNPTAKTLRQLAAALDCTFEQLYGNAPLLEETPDRAEHTPPAGEERTPAGEERTPTGEERPPPGKPLGFADALRALREGDGLTQEQVARRLDIAKSTVSMYEKGNREPDFRTLGAIAAYFHVDMNRLMGVAPSARDAWARPILAAYQEADVSTQAAACAVLRIPHVTPGAWDEAREEEETESILTFAYPSAAGIPLYVEGEFEQRDFPKSEIPAGTDFAILVDGDSMEPTIRDGSYVFVHKQEEIQNGQIGIFMLGDGDVSVCKRYYQDKDGTRLLSDNPKYKPIVIGAGDEGFRLVGRVLK